MKKKNKSLYEIAMEQKRENDRSVDKQYKNSALVVVFEIVSKIIRCVIYLAICVLLTVGTTVLINSNLRNEIINIIKLNVSL